LLFHFRGSKTGVYIHSSEVGDQAVSYNDQTGPVTFEDNFFRILPGIGHVSPTVFSHTSEWGGPAWRSRRQFAGRIARDITLRMWQPLPAVHVAFPRSFREGALTLLLAQRRANSPLSALPVDMLMHVLGLCPFDWFADRPATYSSRGPFDLRSMLARLHGWPQVGEAPD